MSKHLRSLDHLKRSISTSKETAMKALQRVELDTIEFIIREEGARDELFACMTRFCNYQFYLSEGPLKAEVAQDGLSSILITQDRRLVALFRVPSRGEKYIIDLIKIIETSYEKFKNERRQDFDLESNFH